jgi:hypothetical protein
MPKSRFSINAFLAVTAIATALCIPDIVTRFSTEDRGGAWQLPELS